LVKESGSYALLAQNDHCLAASDSVELSVLAFPNAAITAPNDLNICEGESIVLTIEEEAENYTWYYFDSVLEEGTDSITVSQAGEYYATASNGDCIDDSESIFIEVTKFPNDSLIILGETDLCEGETVQISAFGQADLFEWFVGDSLIEEAGNSLTINQSGIYQLEASNNDCKTIFAPVEVFVTNYPSAEVSITGEPIYCEGDSATVLFAMEGQANIYSWFLDGVLLPDEEANTLLVPSQGNYFSVATNLTPTGKACPDTSFVIEVAELALPEIEIFALDTLVCNGNETFLEATEGYENYIWFQNQIIVSDGDEFGITIEDGGDFQVQVFDGQCSNISEIQKILFFDAIVPEITADGNILTSTEAEEYQWLLDGADIPQANGQTYEATESGVYSIITIDENGCTAVSNEIEIIVSNTKAEYLNRHISLFPNPVSENLFLKFSMPHTSDYQLIIVNSIGQILNQQVLENISNETVEIDLSNVEKGVYFLKILEGNRETVKRFIKH
jgi:hypothetical protein